MTRKLFVIALIVTIFVTGCAPAMVATETQTVISEQIYVQTPVVTSVVIPTSTPEIVYDSQLVELHQGEEVKIKKVELKNGVYKVMLETLQGVTFVYYERDEVTISQSIIEDEFTHGEGRFYDYGEYEDLKKDIIAFEDKIFVYEIGSVSENGLVSAYFYEVYTPTKKDIALKVFIDKHYQGYFGDDAKRYPIQGVDDLLYSYNEWGTKDGLKDFLDLINYPTTVEGFYMMYLNDQDYSNYLPYFQIESDGDRVKTEEFLASLPTTLDVSILGKSQYIGKFQVILYRKGMVPDEFMSKIREFPNGKVILNDQEFEFLEFTNSYEFEKGVLLKVGDSQVAIPHGYTIAILDQTIEEGCDGCWSPLADYDVVAVYR